MTVNDFRPGSVWLSLGIVDCLTVARVLHLLA